MTLIIHPHLYIFFIFAALISQRAHLLAAETHKKNKKAPPIGHSHGAATSLPLLPPFGFWACRHTQHAFPNHCFGKDSKANHMGSSGPNC